jgi:anti-sigma factor RsiW
MTGPLDAEHPSDTILVAYLDGALPPTEHMHVARLIAEDSGLQERLVLLSSGNRPFREAFEPLLAQAPKDRLEAMLAALPAEPSKAAEASGASSWWKGATAIAAAILIFFAGLAAGRLLPLPNGEVPEAIHEAIHADGESDWRQAVAEYLSLYTTETLVGIPDDMNQRERELAVVSSKMRLPLSVGRIALPNVTPKRAQIFEYDGKPLGQIAYLDPESGPMALCIVMDDSDVAPQVEQREGFNVVYWSSSGHGFMLIGKAPVPRLQEFAKDLSGRLAG